jgi:hypothetical protein
LEWRSHCVRFHHKGNAFFARREAEQAVLRVDIREFIGSQDDASDAPDALRHSSLYFSQDQRYRFSIKEKGAFDFTGVEVLEYVCEIYPLHAHNFSRLRHLAVPR